MNVFTFPFRSMPVGRDSKKGKVEEVKGSISDFRSMAFWDFWIVIYRDEAEQSFFSLFPWMNGEGGSDRGNGSPGVLFPFLYFSL